MAKCGYRTLEGDPCENPVAPGSDHCAADHPVASPMPLAVQGAAASTGPAPDLEDLASTLVLHPPSARAKEAPPLQDFRVVGITEQTTVVNAGTPFAREVASGHCWHCGTNIRICVMAKNLKTGEVVSIGQTCAERIGLDKDGLKKYLAERYAEQRVLRSKAYQEEQRRIQEQWEAAQTKKFGAHGTLSRYEGGCSRGGAICDECRATAPHGTVDHFWVHRCACGSCVDAVLKHNRDFYISENVPVLVSLETGRIVPNAKMVQGQFGTSWWIPGGGYVPAFRKRRDTVARRGYTYARAKMLLERSHSRDTPDWQVRVLEQPTVDVWGEPISPQLTGG